MRLYATCDTLRAHSASERARDIRPGLILQPHALWLSARARAYTFDSYAEDLRTSSSNCSGRLRYLFSAIFLRHQTPPSKIPCSDCAIVCRRFSVQNAGSSIHLSLLQLLCSTKPLNLNIFFVQLWSQLVYQVMSVWRQQPQR